jgi:omega-amidase
MKIAFIQTSLFWEDAEANRNQFSEKIQSIPEAVDLVILPEMFSTGFTMNPAAVAETMDGKTVSWMKSIAIENQMAICGSVVITENGNYYNRLLFVFPDGKIQHYDKRHLFTLAGEDKVYTAGVQKLVVEYKGFKICPLVCYDLRFPVFARNKEDYDLLIFVANWPEKRVHAWDTLLNARAIENMCYVVGVNRIGNDHNGHRYIGHSQALDCLGNHLVKPVESEGFFIANLGRNEMIEVRKNLDFLNDRDDFTVA